MSGNGGQSRKIQLVQLVLLADPSSPLRSALLDAATEAAQFYQVPGGWQLPASLSRLRIVPQLTTQLISSDKKSDVQGKLVADDVLSRVMQEASTGGGLYDQAVLGPGLHQLADSEGASVLVTDLEITPPAHWRYIIWDATPNGAVISAAPLDPAYWDVATDEATRMSTAKARVRAASLCVLGSMLGLQRCRNERCFLFANVDSILRLDATDQIGPEHGIEELAGRTVDGDS